MEESIGVVEGLADRSRVHLKGLFVADVAPGCGWKGAPVYSK